MWHVLTSAVEGWSRHRVASLGAALAYYSVFSLGPLLLIVTATAGLIFGEDAVRGEITNQFRGLLGPVGSQAVEAMLKGAANQKAGTFAALFGIVLLLIAALAVVVQLKDALNTIWEVDDTSVAGWRTYLRTYLISFAGILGLGFLLAVSLIVNASLAAAASWFGASAGEAAAWEAVNFTVSLLVLGVLFGLVFKWFPDTEVSWKDVAPGAFVTAVLFNLGKMAIAWYIGSRGLESTYGAATSLVILLIWAYYSAQILLFGAELTHAYAAQRRAVPSSGSKTVLSPSRPKERRMAQVRILPPEQIEALAANHGVSTAAVETLASSMARSGGGGAQFDHPELGGMGQWMTNGMLMIGDMFNHQLKARIDRLCRDVEKALANAPVQAERAARTEGAVASWRPSELGIPASVGSQNEMRYAFFPDKRRLALEENGALAVYDTGEHRLTGFSQQQAALRSVAFSSAAGSVPLSKFQRVETPLKRG
jgi:membrane protein